MSIDPTDIFKYRYLLRVLACCFLFVVSANALATNAPPSQLRFTDIMKNHEFALGEVLAIHQDDTGYIWLGGRNALLRYDGYSMQEILLQETVDDTNTFSSIHMVENIMESQTGAIWIASKSGLLLYNHELGVLQRLTPQDGNNTEIYIGSVNHITELPTGEILAATYYGLYRIDPITFNAIRITHIPDDPNALPSDIIYNVFVDREQRIWLGTYSGISQFFPATNTFKNYVPDREKPQSMQHNSVLSITQDQQGDFWLATRKGVVRFKPESNAFTRFLHDPNSLYTIGDNGVLDVFVDSKGWLWVSTNSGGIAVYDHSNERFQQYRTGDQVGSITSDSVRTVYEDRRGDIWVGLFPSGLNFHDRSSTAIQYYQVDFSRFERSIGNDNVSVVMEDDIGNLWIGTGGTIDYLDRSSGTFKHYTKTDDENSQLQSVGFLSGHIDSDGDVWFGTWGGGIHQLDPTTDRFIPIPNDPTLAGLVSKTSRKLPDNVAWRIYEDKQKNLWISTHHSGLSKYNKHTGEFTNYHQNSEGPSVISNPLIWTTLEDSKGRFWIGTASTLTLFDRQTETFKHYTANPAEPGHLVNGSVLSLFEDSQQRLWVGTDEGLHLFNPETEYFTVYTKHNGLADHGIRSITEDHKGNLWLGTNKGFSMFNPDSEQVNNYTKLNGSSIGGMITGSATNTKNGEIVFGGVEGLFIINPEELATNSTPPPVVFTDFKIFTDSVPVNGKEKILTKVIQQTDELTLDYTKSMFSFHFAALNYRSTHKNRYAYRLEGFDNAWREVGTERKAQYTNLSPGTYQLHVKASNNDGVWNEQGAKIKIVQLPPPWRTWWAYALYFLTGAAILAKFVYDQKRKRKLVEKQNRILEQKVAERTADLSAKNKDIEIMLSNMRQGLFTIEPSGTIHPEYSRFLESIFETNQLAGKDALELLFSKALLGANAIDQAKQAIQTMVGEDDMNFSFNAHLLIQEYALECGNQTKHLSLDWNPIVHQSTVEKLMVSVRDVTQLKAMEKEAMKKTRELEIIGQLINLPAKTLSKFIASSRTILTENQSILDRTNDQDPDSITILFRNMHTLKGNCRTYNFSYLVDSVHHAESVYSALKDNPQKAWDKQQMIQDLKDVRDMLEEYVTIYEDVLNRGKTDSERSQWGSWLPGESLEEIRKTAEQTELAVPEVKEKKLLAPIHRLMEKSISASFEQTLQDVIQSLTSIAKQLKKNPPNVRIAESNVRIHEIGQELVVNVLTHILRNSVDHGIETPSEREAANKPATGTIEIIPQFNQDFVSISVNDDGKGLDLAGLFKKGVASEKWPVDATVINRDIAQLIFDSGVSTKESVTDISGRGVGMDAVKSALNSAGGDIVITFDAENAVFDPSNKLPCPFKVVITLPTQYFIKSQ